MSVHIKSAEEIEKMRIAGRLAAEVLEMIEPHVQAGITTNQLDKLCHDYIVNEQQAIPAPLNYHGFPKSICTSVNHVICHGIPNEKKIKHGDVINIDGGYGGRPDPDGGPGVKGWAEAGLPVENSGSTYESLKG